MAKRLPLKFLSLDHPMICNICGIVRNKGNHQRCSRIRQRQHEEDWK